MEGKKTESGGRFTRFAAGKEKIDRVGLHERKGTVILWMTSRSTERKRPHDELRGDESIERISSTPTFTVDCIK